MGVRFPPGINVRLHRNPHRKFLAGMSRSDLERLSKEELIEPVLRL
jgi:hypothetical protein